MSGFHKYRLRDLISLQRGYDLTETERQSGKVPIVGSAGVHGYHNQARAKGPGITIGRSGGSFGKVTFIREDFWPHNTTIFVTDFKGNDPLFIRYLLETVDFSLLNSGSAQQSLNRNFVYRIPIKEFSRGQQRKIAAILSAYDELIESNKRRIALLEKLAGEIYREWFVRLRFPGYEKVRLVRGVPGDWEVKRISEIVEFLSGYSFKSETYISSGSFGIVTIKNVQDGYFIPECTDFIDALPDNMKSHCVLRGGDVLMSLTGNVGRVCQVYGSNLLLNQRIAKLESKLKKGSQFLYYTFRNRSMLQLIENLSLGSTAQMNLSPIQLGKQKLVVPDPQLLLRFERTTHPLTSLALNLRRQSENLRESRNAILPRLISAKLPVENLEIQFPPGMIEELDQKPDLTHHA
jgi:type I restriction enzyme S subunit